MLNPSGIILVIDDEPSIRDFIKSFLTEENYRVYLAGNGNEALEIFRKQKVDVVITDIVMPKKGGVNAIMCLKGVDPAVKIIAMSGADNKEDFLDLAKSFGASETIHKPFKPEDLLEKVQKLVNLKKSAA